VVLKTLGHWGRALLPPRKGGDRPAPSL